MSNNIILTGMPGSGKSTLLARLVEKIPKKRGFLTREILNEEGQRVGFECVGDNDYTQRLAHVDFKDPINHQKRVGKYGVFVKGFEAFINQRRFSDFSEGEILYLDEIGQMQLYSEKFRELARAYLDSENLFLGTLSELYHNDFTEEIRNRKDVDIFEITPENRDCVLRELENKCQIYRQSFFQNASLIIK